MLRSGFLPKSIRDPNQLMTIVLMGRELEIAPMAALNNISVINGKPCIEAKLMLALVFRRYPDAIYRVLESDCTRASIEIGRAGQEPSVFSWTIEEAKQANLLGKDNWSKYPADMLMARCISRAVRQSFPEVILNAPYTPEEMQDVTPVLEVVKEKKEKTISPEIEERRKYLSQVVTKFDAEVIKKEFGLTPPQLQQKINLTKDNAALDRAESRLFDLEQKTAEKVVVNVEKAT